ncbi:MAG: hypothetical protein IPN67_19715 [Bacteroidales bacterium]|nr:hypothetical protein [Bacteroidales bacterium]
MKTILILLTVFSIIFGISVEVLSMAGFLMPWNVNQNLVTRTALNSSETGLM